MNHNDLTELLLLLAGLALFCLFQGLAGLIEFRQATEGHSQAERELRHLDAADAFLPARAVFRSGRAL